MTTRICKRSQKTSLEVENENHPFRKHSLDYKRAEQSDHGREVIETALVKTSCVFDGRENLTSKSYHLREGCKLNNE